MVSAEPISDAHDAPDGMAGAEDVGQRGEEAVRCYGRVAEGAAVEVAMRGVGGVWSVGLRGCGIGGWGGGATWDEKTRSEGRMVVERRISPSPLPQKRRHK